MVAAVLKASAVGAWVSSFGIPSGHSSRCSTWVSQLAFEPARTRRVDNVAIRCAQRWPLAPSDSGLSGSFRGDRLGWKVVVPEKSTRTRTVRVSASSQDDANLPDPFDGIDLDPGVFKEQTFQKVKAQYNQPLNLDDFLGDEALMAEREGQQVLGKLVHERFEVQELVAEGGPVQIWNWMKRAQGMLGALALTVVMLMHMPGPPKPPVMRDLAPHRRAVKAAAPRRGRNAALRGTPLNEHVSPMELFPQAIIACMVLATMTHLLKNAGQQTPRLVQKEPKMATGMTAFHLHLGISGFACSLRYDLDEVGSQLDDWGHVQRPETLKTIARVLMRHLEHIVYAGNQVMPSKHPFAYQTFINNWEHADASHIRLAPTKEMLQNVGKDYGRKVEEQKRMLIDSYKAGYTVVTLSGAVRGRLSLPQVNNSLNLHDLLATLEVLDPANVKQLKLSWKPTSGETLPEETMLTYFPHMTLLAEPAAIV
ncbi:hypothetical protein KFL_004830090 [Klebsormidium nitens]|uniref:Uncharacterized protein n=1 Tax=Klebsormidium nitens TaxID=105231 RepID=A0A1Y1ILS4_KLENI|nr:hypothetical protein KFL_004830090 [Klebsormidium nitens]|eukprot:GAQ89058.1 hypothetical protein KFL_004830090 [Klebsormidium nitens]